MFHPAYAGVSLGLLHGTQPDVIVVCHDPSRREIAGHCGFEIPALEEVIAQNLALGGRTNATIRCAGISLNTSKMSAADAQACLVNHAARLKLPCADPIRGGRELDRLIDAVLDQS